MNDREREKIRSISRWIKFVGDFVGAISFFSIFFAGFFRISDESDFSVWAMFVGLSVFIVCRAIASRVYRRAEQAN